MKTVGEAGESEVLARVLARLSVADSARVGPGDDAAVLALRGDLAITTDTMIEGSDFRLQWHSGLELGRKLAASNLSDIAAMGARPIALTVALACPRDTPVALLEAISNGVSDACRGLAPGCGVVGGDLSTAPVLTAAVTALGDFEGRSPVLRSGARAGDIVAYSGQLGLAGIGLNLLFRHATENSGHAHNRTLESLRVRYPAAISAQLTPRPPIDAGITAAEAGASAMLDVSDGLSLDAARIAAASGVTISLESELLFASFGEQEGQQVSVNEMMTGGEDHGMLATFSPGVKLPQGFSVIGFVTEGRSDRARVLLDGDPFEPCGWDPFRVTP